MPRAKKSASGRSRTAARAVSPSASSRSASPTNTGGASPDQSYSGSNSASFSDASFSDASQSRSASPSPRPRARASATRSRAGGAGRSTGKAVRRTKTGKLRAKAKFTSFKKYYAIILKQIISDADVKKKLGKSSGKEGFSHGSVRWLDNYVKTVFEKIVKEATNMSRDSKKQTLSVRDLHSAIRVIFPAEFGKFAINAGDRAVSKVTSSKDGDGTRKELLAGIVIPVGRIQSMLKKETALGRVGGSAGVWLAGVIDYVVGELLEVARVEAAKAKHVRVSTQALARALKADDDLAYVGK